MPNKYLASIRAAKAKYIAQSSRPGFPTGFFSMLRYKLTSMTAIESFDTELGKIESDSEASEYIKGYLKSSDFNDHSFTTYLLDELLKDFYLEGWQQFNPKRIIFYQGTLYRGTTLSPNYVFTNGFPDLNPSQNIEDYAANCNGSVGVSTSKKYSIAHSYALPRIHPMHDMVEYHPYGYVYQINYRGHVGVDIEETQRVRRYTFWENGKKEVNVVGKIKPSDIVGAWKVTRTSEDESEVAMNPAYLTNRVQDSEDLAPGVIEPARDFAPVSESSSSSSMKLSA